MVSHVFEAYPSTTDLRNLAALSTTSSHMCDTECSSNRLPSGNDWRASKLSCKSSLHKSMSSPDLHARRRNANAKLIAALEPTRAKPVVALSRGLASL